jgi:predicted DsbA family dithiol-disulfide isomerase
VRIDIWSDVVCPWCYIGKRRIEAALERFPHRDDVELVFHAFQLDPSAPRTAEHSLTEMLSKKYGMPVAQAAEMEARVSAVAAEDGLEFHFEAARPSNTFDAHRLIAWAKTKDRQADMKERLLAAYFTEGKRVGEVDTLVALAAELGLDAEEARTVLTGNAFATEVRADIEQAQRYNIRGVPFFVVDQKFGVSGAQPADALLAAMSRAWGEQA